MQYLVIQATNPEAAELGSRRSCFQVWTSMQIVLETILGSLFEEIEKTSPHFM